MTRELHRKYPRRQVSGRGENHRPLLRLLVSLEFANEAFDRLIASAEATVSTKSCQIAVALRSRLRPSSIASWNGFTGASGWNGLGTFRLGDLSSARQTRWTPRWPDLPAVVDPMHPTVALRSPRPSDSCRLSPDVPQSLARCAAMAIQAVPGQLPAVFCLRSRRCSYRRRLQCLMSESFTTPRRFYPGALRSAARLD